MRTVDLVHKKRDGGELTAEEISHLVESYNNGSIPDYQMSAFLMAVYFAGMTDRETEETADLILDLAKDRTIVVVEHDMAFVRSLGARVTVLHEGSVLAEG